jgi:hypothetical protein
MHFRPVLATASTTVIVIPWYLFEMFFVLSSRGIILCVFNELSFGYKGLKADSSYEMTVFSIYLIGDPLFL